MNNVTLSDQFEQPQGKFVLYDTYDANTRLRVINQAHVDIRSFNNEPGLTEWRMLELDQATMGELNPLEMGTLEGSYTYANGEGWTTGTAGSMADRNNWYGLSLTCPPGVTTTTESIIPLVNLPGEVEAIDILTDFEDDDYLSLALPDFPLAEINTTQSWLDLTSHPTGDFVSGPVASLRLADSTIPLVDGDSEYRRLRSSITGIDLQRITGVRFRIEANTSCTFRAAALRLLSKDWRYTNLDIDTRLQIMKPTVAPNGSLTLPYDFTFPILFRSGSPPGADDPRPIDLSVSVGFNTGSELATNRIILYFREGPGDFTQMLDLNGKSMADLNGQPQPNVVSESYRSRTQAELDEFLQSDLQGDTQREIERTVDPEIARYITATLQWAASTFTVTLSNSEGNGHTFPISEGLSPNTPHAFVLDLIDKTMRARVYPMDLSGNILIDRVAFDSSVVRDDFIFVRRAGRFGWTAFFGDGDTHIDNISTRRQVYAELKTAAYTSLTPVSGAELHIAGSRPIEFFDELYAGHFVGSGVTVNRDRNRSTTGLSWRVSNPGTSAPQGIQTNLADFYDFNEIEISFDLYYPKAALDAGINLEAYLSNNFGRVVPVPLGKILPDRWHSLTLSAGGQTAQTGRYSFFLVQTATGAPSTWWIDNFHIRERTLSFYGRSVAADPWGDADADWVPFKNSINREGTGAQFLERGNSLQVLGQAHRQSSHIDNIKIVPKYAQLGRLVWEEDELYNPQRPTAIFTATPNGLTVTFNGISSYDADGDIINYRWNFGDGNTATGPIVNYTYQRAGSYTPSLVVTDTQGLQASASETMFVTNA